LGGELLSRKKELVLIEDQPEQADLIRQGLRKEIKDLTLLPAVRPSYLTIEDFAKSKEGGNHGFDGVIVVDLFYAGLQNINPAVVFHQLMSTFYTFPPDKIVCGRLGLLKQLCSTYKDAHIHLFSYLANYLEGEFEPLPVEDPALFEPESLFSGLFSGRRDVTKEHTSAMKDALMDRLSSVFGPITDAVGEKRGHTAKTDNFEADVEKLATTLKTLY
jgi:hypothetical protein